MAKAAGLGGEGLRTHRFVCPLLISGVRPVSFRSPSMVPSGCNASAALAPRKVPFRMTRDVVDGMGVTGVEGACRRCCEETMRVLRANKDSLLTIIEAGIRPLKFPGNPVQSFADAVWVLTMVPHCNVLPDGSLLHARRTVWR